ncbi:MAG: HD domain-containing protein [Xanthobacteraceae bacterium]
MRSLTPIDLMEKSTPEIQSLIAALVGLPRFKRLSRVSFLGAIERFAPRTDRRSAQSRYEHSIGVADLVIELSKRVAMTEGELRLAIAHALLHDVGHGPFSHSCENFFRKKFSIDHHSCLIDLIENEKSDESKTLRYFGVWLDYRNFLRDPKKIPLVQELFFGPINVDTIEGILRSSIFFGIERPIDITSVINALSSRPLKFRCLDEFWALKQTVYNDFIFSEVQARYDAIICNALFYVSDEVALEDFDLDDEGFEERYHSSITHQLNLANAFFEKISKKRERQFGINEYERPRKNDLLGERYFERKAGECKKKTKLSNGTSILQKPRSRN